MPGSEYKKQIESVFILKPQIKSFKVYDYEICKLMVEDMLREMNISNRYYIYGKEKINEVYDKIKIILKIIVN